MTPGELAQGDQNSAAIRDELRVLTNMARLTVSEIGEVEGRRGLAEFLAQRFQQMTLNSPVSADILAAMLLASALIQLAERSDPDDK